MRVFLSLILAITLSGCGFSPMYGESSKTKNSSVTATLNSIEINIIPDRSGQYLRNALMDRFYQTGVPPNPTYKLVISPINETVSNFDLTINSEATRRQLRLNTVIELINLSTDEVVFKRSLIAIASHNVLESEFSTIVTEQSSRDAALNDLARQIERQIALQLSR